MENIEQFIFLIFDKTYPSEGISRYLSLIKEQHASRIAVNASFENALVLFQRLGRMPNYEYDIEGYDSCYRPDYPEGKFDTIICVYVLNVLEPYAQAEVMWEISNLLAPGGTVYYAVRRDLKEEGFRWHAIHKQYTYQCNVVLPYKSLVKNKGFEVYWK